MKTILIFSLDRSPIQQDVIKAFQSLGAQVIEALNFNNLESLSYDSICVIGSDKTFELSEQFQRESDQFTQLFKKAYTSSLPIGVMGSARTLLALSMKEVPLTLAKDPQEQVRLSFKNKIFWEDCPSDDFISDRETKVVSHCGFSMGSLDNKETQKSLKKFAQEVYEWA